MFLHKVLTVTIHPFAALFFSLPLRCPSSFFSSCVAIYLSSCDAVAAMRYQTQITTQKYIVYVQHWLIIPCLTCETCNQHFVFTRTEWNTIELLLLFCSHNRNSLGSVIFIDEGSAECFIRSDCWLFQFQKRLQHRISRRDKLILMTAFCILNRFPDRS